MKYVASTPTERDAAAAAWNACDDGLQVGHRLQRAVEAATEGGGGRVPKPPMPAAVVGKAAAEAETPGFQL